MEDYQSRNSIRRKVLKVVCAVLIMVLVVLVIVVLVRLNTDKIPGNGVSGMTGGSVTTHAGEVPQLQVQSVLEQEDAVLVETTYGTFKYPYAFSDLMRVEAETLEDYAVLEFGAMIDGVVVELYTLMFNRAEGIPVGTLQVDGDIYAVTAQFHDASGVSENSMATFYAVQETFNDVVNSLSENEGFTAAD